MVKRFVRVLLSKTFLSAMLILLQIALFVALFVGLQQAGTVAYIVITLISILVMSAVVEHDNVNPSYKIMWMLIVVWLPITGVLFYLWWGSQRITRRNVEKFAPIESAASAAMVQENAAVEALCRQEPTLARNVEYLLRSASAPLYRNTSGEYFPMGQAFFARFQEVLRGAKRFIFMEYFIIEESWMWSETLEILRRKAAEGVDVRVVYDAFGSMFTLPPGYDATLRAMGIKCQPFNPVAFSLHISDYKMLNNRDHRKIAVVDGEAGFTGGLNFADEYINRKQRFGVWKDTGVMLKGPGVYSLTVTFLKMWDYVSGTQTRYEEYRPCGEYEADGFVQPYCDSPLDGEAVSENAYRNVLRRAQEYVYIVTPYLILDNEMITALRLAAQSGVDVRILTPGIPDKWYVYYVTQSYYARLLEAGVRIYEYTPGFVHAKMYVSDDKEAIVGSANMDYRSLYLHFENCCAFYGGHVVRDVRDDIRATLQESREVTMADVNSTPLPKWLAQVFLRFFSPMM